MGCLICHYKLLYSIENLVFNRIAPLADDVMKLTAKLLKNCFFLLFALLFSLNVFGREGIQIGDIYVADLPKDAQHTLALIKSNGPFPYAKDGVIFRNYEGLLPKRKRGYYREFTVRTPGARNRGARRIVSGGEPATSGEYYYTDDHYASFRRIRE